MTILDNRRSELDTRIGWLRQEIEALKAKLDRLQVERTELDDYVPAVDPETGEVR
ncbi:MAG TPA: hypothetical protein VFY97_06475 [Rhodanobacteraceae bacterium]|nr:hypothetical protein [Rhodanobacteraceae bacterium]